MGDERWLFLLSLLLSLLCLRVRTCGRIGRRSVGRTFDEGVGRWILVVVDCGRCMIAWTTTFHQIWYAVYAIYYIIG